MYTYFVGISWYWKTEFILLIKIVNKGQLLMITLEDGLDALFTVCKTVCGILMHGQMYTRTMWLFGAE